MVATNTIMLLSPPSTSSQLLFLLDVIFLYLFLLVLVCELHFFFLYILTWMFGPVCVRLD